ncbi:ribosomal RNA processing protein 36 homolog isoform X2 [Latimeria chalumnae]|nr:PREDICTED: ribosomal RNA processing protein 36 homolog isoform X2 [Latimeria chalumnae]|eukprot:XP_014339610.1 PREDICTED: ribosomal RNA processing protein 36 homolog isoform X2 [Latimeria chalumnae]
MNAKQKSLQKLKKRNALPTGDEEGTDKKKSWPLLKDLATKQTRLDKVESERGSAIQLEESECGKKLPKSSKKCQKQTLTSRWNWKDTGNSEHDVSVDDVVSQEDNGGDKTGSYVTGVSSDSVPDNFEETADGSAGETGSDITDVSDEDDKETHSLRTEGADGKKLKQDDVKKELSTMSFEELLLLQNKVGTKAFNRIAYGSQGPEPLRKKHLKRLNKNRPVEISAKKPAAFLRQVVPVRKRVARDPRFDDLSGEYNPEIFDKTYTFLDDIRKEEKGIVEKQLKKTKNLEEKEQLQTLLQRMTYQENAQQQKQMQRQKELEFKRQQRELVQQGKKPFFLKSSDKRKLHLAEQYKRLKKSGKLESFLSKKRKRNAIKDRKRLPF